MLLESKSLLAKLMATENLVVEQRKVSTALFDTVSRVLIVPILDNNIPPHTYDLFMGHEVGHALWTPSNGHEIREKYGVPHSIANLVEDSRIERKIKYKYPGLKNSFIRGYKDLLDRNFFETKGVNINTMKFVDRLNLHCKGGALLNIQFSEKEMELVKAVESTETYDDVMVVCQKIIKLIKETAKNQETVQLPMPIDDEEEDDLSDLIMHDEEDDDDESEDDGKSETTEEEEDDFEETGEVSSEDDEDSEKTEETDEDDEESEEAGDEKFGADDALDEKIEELLESETDMAYKNNEYKLFSEKSLDYTYANIPKLTSDQTVVDFKKVYETYDAFKSKVYWLKNYNPYDYEGFKTLRDEIKTGVSYLVKEFEMRKSADQLKKASPAKTGDLNLNKIYSHEFNEDIFKKITVMPDAKSHGLVIFLDWSGSMTSHIQNTVKQLFNIVMFCKKVNIPYEVYTFTNPSSDQFEFKQERKAGDLLMDYFCLLNVLSSRMNAAQFTKAAAALVYMSNASTSRQEKIIPDIFNMSGTPLNHTIVAAMEIVPEFQRKYGLQMVNTIFLTDGDGDSGLDIIENDSSKTRMSHWNYRTNSPTHLILRDPVTKYYEKVDYTSSRTITSTFIKLFKHRTKSNIVGFYILSPAEFKSYMQRNFEYKGIDTQDIRANFSKNNCAVIHNDGFDEYYLLKSKRGDNEEPELLVKENASNKSLANAFAKYNNKRNTNRVVLNRFINMIA